MNAVERVYPKTLNSVLFVLQLFETLFYSSFEQQILWCGKNTKHSNFRSQILRHFASLLQILSSGGLPKQNSWFLNFYLSLLFSSFPARFVCKNFFFSVRFSHVVSSPFRLSFSVFRKKNGVRLRRYPPRRKYSHSAQAAIFARLLTSFCELKTISRFQV